MKPTELTTLLSKTIPARLPVLITGAPGIGKSDLVAQACAAANCELIISHPVVSDPTDYKGLPFPAPGGNEAVFLPFGELARLVAAESPTVFFLDDLGQAPPSVQAACMQLLLARRVNGHRVSDQVCFVAATNRRADRAGVQGLLEPVKSRFATIIELVADLNDWVAWALRAGLPTELISFLRFRPNLLHDFQPTQDLTNSPSPRTWHNVARLMAAGADSYETISGAVGEGAAAEFVGFLKIFKSLPNPDVILMNPSAAEVPDDPATLYALCGALARKASQNTMGRLVEYFNRLPAEFSVLAVRDSVQVAPDVCNTRAFVEWASSHADVLI